MIEIHIAMQILLLIAIPFLPLQRILLSLTPYILLSISRKISKKQASLSQSNDSLAQINQVHEFASWAKQRRKRDKILAEIELLSESLKSSTSTIKWIVRILTSVLTTVFITWLIFMNQKRAMVYLPFEWTGYFFYR
jgi:hypothetical protein